MALALITCAFTENGVTYQPAQVADLPTAMLTSRKANGFVDDTAAAVTAALAAGAVVRKHDLEVVGSPVFNRTHLTPVGASIGDSIAGPDYNGSDKVTNGAAPTNILKGAKGFITWALILSGQRVRVPATTNIWSYPGEETSRILTELSGFIAQMPRKPGFVSVECGTNNIYHDAAGTGVGSFRSIIADWQAIAVYLASLNIRTIFVPILPRTGGFSTLFTPAQFDVMDKCNRWLNDFAARSQGMVAVASACLPSIADPASIGAQPKTEYSYDGTHPAVAEAYYIGKAISDIWRTWYPPIDLLPYHDLTWASGSLENTNFLVNGMMEGTTGTVTTPSSGTISGTAPTSWTAAMSNTAGLTVANSQVVSAITGRRMHQMVFGGSYTVSGAAFPQVAYNQFGRLWQNPSTASLAGIRAGDKLRAMVEFEIDAANNCIAFPHLQFRYKGAANYNADLQLNEGYLPPDAISGVLMTESHTYLGSEMPLTAGELTHNLFAYLRNTNGTYACNATVRFGRAIIAKVDE